MAGNRTNRQANQIPARVLTPAQALALLMAEVAQQAETPEPGFLTTADWGKAWSVNWKTARIRLMRGFNSGIVETKEFRLAVGKQFRKVPHYKVIERQK